MNLRLCLLFMIVSGSMALLVMGGAKSHPVMAQGIEPTITPSATPSGNPHENGDCLACHSKPITVKYADGDTDTGLAGFVNRQEVCRAKQVVVGVQEGGRDQIGLCPAGDGN